MRELRAIINAGDVEKARTAAESLAPFWKTIEPREGLRGAVLDVAADLDVAETAAMLLEPFRVEALLPRHADGLAAAAQQYGEGWTRGVVNGWFGSGHHVENNWYGWVDTSLVGLCGALQDTGRQDVARLLATGVWRRIRQALHQWTDISRTDVCQPQLTKLGSLLVQLLVSADDDLRDEIIAAVREYPDTVLECVVPALRVAETQPKVLFDALARACVERLEAIVARPLRAEDGWSIEWAGCGCGVCDTLGAFLGSRSRRTFEWPLAKNGRQHVHTKIDLAGLPVRHRTRRQGRPFTLVLTKTDELFTRATNTRDRATADLAWLTSTWFRQLPKA